MLDTILLALDQSVRSYDDDGRLRVAVSHISKATVNPYRGSEIPGGEQLGLDPNAIYQLLRDPDELAKAAPTFNGIPLLDQHIPVSAADSRREHVVGSTGTEAAFVAPYLNNSLSIWDDAAIAGIEHGAQRELSAAYHYDPDMTPGAYSGTKYDGVMRNIRGNHVALVEAGRAGSDVVVMDGAMASEPRSDAMSVTMNTPISPFAAFVAGNTAGYLRSKLAQDEALPDMTKIVAGVTVKNWEAKKPMIAAAVTRAIKGKKLAQDAEVHIHEHLDGAGAEAGAMGAGKDQGAGDPPAAAGAGIAATPVTGDDDLAAKVRELLTAGGIDEEDVEMIVAALSNLKAPAEANGGEPNGGGPVNGDGEGDPVVGDNEGEPKQPAMDRMNVSGRAMRVAMDRKIKAAVDQARADERAVKEAERFIRPWAGELTVAMDSAADVYRFALETLDEDVTGIHPSAYRAILARIPKPGEQTAAARVSLAMDASGNKKYLERFPDANRLLRTR